MADGRKSSDWKPGKAEPFLEAHFRAGGERIPAPGAIKVALERIRWIEGEGTHFTAGIEYRHGAAAVNVSKALALQGDAAVMIEISDDGDPVIEGRVLTFDTESRKIENLNHHGIPSSHTEYRVAVKAVSAGRIENPPKGGDPDLVYHCKHGPEGGRSEKLGDTYRFASGRETRAFICHVCDGIFTHIDRGRACIEGSSDWKVLMRKPGGLARIHTLIAP